MEKATGRGPINTIVVSDKIFGKLPDGSAFDIDIEIGAPYLFGPDEWVCPLHAPALKYSNKLIHAGSALQAMCLAIASVRMSLAYFREDGGKLSFEADGDDDFDIKATFGLSDLF
ncbi:DUF6968 family protein [Asticcacaulis taihuensis]|uniref:DUF6968 family protein n=1 Tax=Asticcacaulis taihuensis TaxID=260084 RepID=UPI0026EAB14E|nr:hypothetical protein [Asticcacaulis taihuensis]